MKSYWICSEISSHSSKVTTPLSTNCVLRRSLNKSENFLRSLAINFWNFTSSRVISADLPTLNELSDSRRDSGTFNARLSFYWKYLTSSSSPRFCPPGSVEISVPLPPSLLGNQKSSSIDMNFLSSLISPVSALYTNLFL